MRKGVLSSILQSLKVGHNIKAHVVTASEQPGWAPDPGPPTTELISGSASQNSSFKAPACSQDSSLYD